MTCSFHITEGELRVDAFWRGDRVRSSVKDAPIYTVEGLLPRTKVQKIWKILPKISRKDGGGKEEHVVSLHETAKLIGVFRSKKT